MFQEVVAYWIKTGFQKALCINNIHTSLPIVVYSTSHKIFAVEQRIWTADYI